MATIGEFFDFIEENGISEDTRIYISDYNGQIHTMGGISSGDPVPDLGIEEGFVSFWSEDVAQGGYVPGAYYGLRFVDHPPYETRLYTVGAIRDFLFDDQDVFFADSPLVAELYNEGDKTSVDGFAIGDPPDNDYTYVLFEEIVA